jgi:hypothetical protein
MGIALSNTFVQQTVNDITQIVNNTVNSVTQTAATNCTGVANLNLRIGTYASSVNSQTGEIQYSQCAIVPEQGTINISQFVSNSCNLTGGIENTLNNQFQNQLKNNIQQYLDNNVKSTNGFLAAGIAIAAQENITTADIATDITNTLTNNLNNTCNAILTASANGEIQICGNYNLNFNQKAVNTNLTTCMVNNLINNISSNQQLDDIVQKAITNTGAGNTGFDLAGIFKWIIIAVVVIIVLVGIGFLLFFIFGNKGGEKKGEENKTEARKRLEFELERKRIEERRIEGERRRELEYEGHELRSPAQERFESEGQGIGEAEREGENEGGYSNPYIRRILDHPTTQRFVNRFTDRYFPNEGEV